MRKTPAYDLLYPKRVKLNFLQVTKINKVKMPAATSPTLERSSLHLHSLEKISGLPVISSTINLTQGIYGRVKVRHSHAAIEY